MIQSIEIENFRCFEKTEIKGFQRMNLITGKNNSGKTALLEGIYLAISQDINSIKETSRQNKKDTDNQNFLFYNGLNRGIEIYVNIQKEVFRFFYNRSKTLSFDKFLEKTDNTIRLESRGLSKEIKLIFNKDFQIPDLTNITYLFDLASISGKTDRIEDALQIIDLSIEGMRTFSSKPDVLYLKIKDRVDWQPIFYFGDAIQKIIRYVVNIINFDPKIENKILLIDEIENGLHYTAQDEFWRMLFKLCIEFDVQLFATTHSLEMIKAYQRVASEFEGEATYFEMARHAKTNQIIGIKHEMDVLEYELVANETIRGE